MDTSFLQGQRLEVYSTPTCPDCARLERWLGQHAIGHTRIDVDADPAASARLVGSTGKRAVPFILVNGESWVRGYHREEPGRFSPRVLLEELREALERA
jgi:glutaredoxin